MRLNLLLLFVASVLLQAPNFAQTGTWDLDKSPMPVRTAGSTAELVDGKVFVIGGWTALAEKPDSTFPYDGIQVYDPGADSWDTTRTKMPNPRFNCGSAVVGKKIFLFGGNPYNRLLEVYDTESDSWDTTRTEMKYKNTGSKAVTINGVIYVAGAWDTDKWIAEQFVTYNPDTDTYTSLPSLPHPVGHMSMEVIDEKIYLFGGISITNNTSNPINIIQVFDPSTEIWEVLDLKLPGEYWLQGSFVRGSMVYLVAPGGEFYGNNNTEVLEDLVMIDLANSSARVIGSYPYHNCYPIVVDLGESVFATSGFDSDTPEITSYEEFNPQVTYYTPVKNPIYPGNINLDRSYLSVNNDSIHLTCEFISIANEDFSAVCKLSNLAGDVIDSLALIDDGMHGDNEADDGLYGAYYKTDREFEAQVCVYTSNSLNNEQFHCFDLKRFTSIGPVAFAGVRYFSVDTVPDPGDRLTLRPFLKNLGLEALATNISADFYPIDDKIEINDYHTDFGDLVPQGEESMGMKMLNLRIATDCNSGDELRLGVNIYSGENLFWQDTVVVKIGQGFMLGSEKIEIKDPESSDFLVFPNPVNNECIVSFELAEFSQVSLEILDLSGRVKEFHDYGLNAPGRNQVNINLNHLADGIYLIRLQTGSNTAFQKVIKQ